MDRDAGDPGVNRLGTGRRELLQPLSDVGDVEHHGVRAEVLHERRAVLALDLPAAGEPVRVAETSSGCAIVCLAAILSRSSRVSAPYAADTPLMSQSAPTGTSRVRTKLPSGNASKIDGPTLAWMR